MKLLLSPISFRWRIAAIIAAFLALCVFLWLRDPGVTEENGFIENSQVAFLLLAIALHGWRRMRAGDAVARLFHLTLALLCLSIAVREVDIDRLGQPEVFGPLEWSVRIALALCWLWLAAAPLRQRSAVWLRKFDLALSPCSRVTLVAMCAYGASWPFDKLVFPLALPAQMLVEESLQVTATILFAAAALCQPFGRASGRIHQNSPA